MKLQTNNIVVLANGKVGVVDAVFGNPLLVVFKTFTSAIDKWNDEGKHKNENYNIVKVYDGVTLTHTNPNDNVYRSSFDLSQLNLLWEA